MSEQALRPAAPRPCRECPFRRAAAPGWLGGHDAAYFVETALSDYGLACHLTIGFTDDGALRRCAPRQCHGAARFAANHCKSPRHAPRLPANKDEFFATRDEFRRHHASRPAATTPRARRPAKPT